MKLNTNYLNKSYYVAMILQYNDELKKEGFKTETKKSFLFGDETYIADLYAENEEEKRIYDFQLAGRKESQRERTETLGELAKSINANPIIIYVKPPIEKQIVFDELETIINDYFISGALPSELSEFSPKTVINAVKIDEIITATLEKELVTLSGCAAIYVTMQFGSDAEFDSGSGKIICESFPLSFTVGLDCDYNCNSIEYEIDTSDFVLKTEENKYIADNKNYISKTRFDTEFKLYQELSECVLNMVSENALLFPAGPDILPQDENEKAALYEERFKKANESYSLANKTVNKFAPFIPKKLFDMLENLKTSCRMQTYWYGEFVIKGRDAASAQGLFDEFKGCVNRTAEIREAQTGFMDFLRTYLESLDVK